MKYKEYVEEYNEYLENYKLSFRKPSNSINFNNLDIFEIATWKDIPHINMYDYPSFEPSEHEKIESPPPPPTQIYTSMPSSIYYPSSRPTVNRYSYSPSKTSGVYSYAPIPFSYNSMPPLNTDTNYPETIPTYNAIPTYSPSKTSGVYSYAPIPFSYNSMPPLNTDTICPTTIPTYSAIPTHSDSNNSINTTIIDFSNYEKYNIALFGIATGIGSFCFCVICAYVYKIYASKKHKLQKIQKNALKREYESLNDIRIVDYNSQF